MSDQELFMDLLMAPSPEVAEKSLRNLNAWVAVVLAEHGLKDDAP